MHLLIFIELNFFPDVHCKTDNAARQGGADYFQVLLSFGTPAFTVDLSPTMRTGTVRRLRAICEWYQTHIRALTKSAPIYPLKIKAHATTNQLPQKGISDKFRKQRCSMNTVREIILHKLLQK